MWRSLLFIPALADKFIAKAHQRGADGIILDLEDSIAPDAKAQARAKLATAVQQLAAHDLDILIRVNASWRLAVRDIEAAVIPGVAALMIPKISGPEQLIALDELITELEIEQGLVPHSIELIGLVETPAALGKADAIAQASQRLRALSLGGEDFALALGAQPTSELLKQPCLDLVIACRAAGISPFGHPGSIAEFRDLDLFRQGVALGRELGCVGSSAIHPAQVAILNDVFTPTEQELDFAQRCVTAYEAALAAGQGAIALDGKMIDIPVYHRARDLLRRFQSIC